MASETSKHENIKGVESVMNMLALEKNLTNFASTSPRLPRRIRLDDESYDFIKISTTDNHNLLVISPRYR